MAVPAQRPAVFLDRDGTLVEDVGYPTRPEQLRLLPGVVEGLRDLAGAGYELVVVSNQSGVARGYLTPAQAERLMQALAGLLQPAGVRLAATYWCPHGPGEGCACRKPAPGLLLRAAAELGLDLPRSWALGDRERDAAAGVAAGCQAILIDPLAGAARVGGAAPPAAAWHRAPDFAAACKLVLGQRARASTEGLRGQAPRSDRR